MRAGFWITSGVGTLPLRILQILQQCALHSVAAGRKPRNAANNRNNATKHEAPDVEIDLEPWQIQAAHKILRTNSLTLLSNDEDPRHLVHHDGAGIGVAARRGHGHDNASGSWGDVS